MGATAASKRSLSLAFQAACDERPPASPATLIEFRLDNAAHIRRAYDEEVLRLVLDHVRGQLAREFGRDGLQAQGLDPIMLVGSRDADAFGVTDRVARGRLSDLCQSLSSRRIPIERGCFRGDIVLPIVAARICGSEDAAKDPFVPAFFGAPVRECSNWAQSYRADLRQADRAIRAIEAARNAGPDVEGCAIMEWQPVRSARSGSGVLFHDGQLRVVERDGARGSPDWSGPLARLGLEHCADAFALDTVLAELRADPDVSLCVRLSPTFLDRDARMEDVARVLRAEPGVGRRLLIEIDEAAIGRPLAECRRIADRLRKFGVRVVIGGFGAGGTSVRQIVAIAPDVVKIDGGYLRRAGGDPKDLALFTGLAALASAVAPTLVATGVDTEPLARLACDAGLHWQQGDFIGGACSYRSWRQTYGAGDSGALCVPPVPSEVPAGSGAFHGQSSPPLADAERGAPRLAKYRESGDRRPSSTGSDENSPARLSLGMEVPGGVYHSIHEDEGPSRVFRGVIFGLPISLAIYVGILVAIKGML